MASRVGDSAQGAADSRGRIQDSSLYLVLKVTNAGLQELSSQVRPGSSEHLFSITSQDSHYEGLAGHDPSPSGSRRNSFRHPKPCGGCSATKSRCTPLSSDPMLCVRCKSKNLAQCPPHVPWALRKANSLSEKRDSSGSPQPQAVTQGFAPPEAGFSAMPPPVPVSNYTNSYSMEVGTQPRGQYDNGSAMQAACPYVLSSSGESLPPYFYGIESGVSGEGFSQMEPPCYPSFSSGPNAEQAFTHVSDVQPPMYFPQSEGPFTYW